MNDMLPLAIDLCCGLGGWTDGFLAEGFRVIGFDIERHDYGTGGYPGELVLQDVLTLHGKQFKDAAVIVASPPYQKYSYMAMPWKRAKALIQWYRESPERIAELNALFNACFRIQREAIEASGRHIPFVVENVRGAQPWVGRSQWSFGSYHLWGDIPALMPIPSRARKFNPHLAIKNNGGSWKPSSMQAIPEDEPILAMECDSQAETAESKETKSVEIGSVIRTLPVADMAARARPARPHPLISQESPLLWRGISQRRTIRGKAQND